MKRMKVVAVLPLVAALTLSACGSGGTASETSTDAAQSSPAATGAPAAELNFGDCVPTGEPGSITLTTVNPDAVTVATVLPNPGFWNGETPDQLTSGFEYCIAANIAYRAGFTSMDVMNLAWDQFISGSAEGYDFAMASTTITDERKEVFDFSQPYFSSNLGVAVQTGSDVTADNIRDKRIGVLQGNMGAMWVTDVLKPNTAPSVYQTQNEMFAALVAGQVDAVITDTTLVLANIQGANGALDVAGQFELDQGYGIVLPKNSPNTAAVDEAVSQMVTDGTLAQLSEDFLTPLFGMDPNAVPVWVVS